jgi:hypothetical protein
MRNDKYGRAAELERMTVSGEPDRGAESFAQVIN